MTNHPPPSVGCLLVGEYVDEAELPAGAAFHPAEVVRPRVVATYVDHWGPGDGTREFTVLLKDDRVVTVRGHALKHWPPAVSGEGGSYGVVVRSAGEEVVVALFKTLDVVGIFHGEMRSDRQTA